MSQRVLPAEASQRSRDAESVSHKYILPQNLGIGHRDTIFQDWEKITFEGLLKKAASKSALNE